MRDWLIHTGKAGIQFYTQIKTVSQQWKDVAAGTRSDV